VATALALPSTTGIFLWWLPLERVRVRRAALLWPQPSFYGAIAAWKLCLVLFFPGRRKVNAGVLEMRETLPDALALLSQIESIAVKGKEIVAVRGGIYPV